MCFSLFHTVLDIDFCNDVDLMPPVELSVPICVIGLRSTILCFLFFWWLMVGVILLYGRYFRISGACLYHCGNSIPFKLRVSLSCASGFERLVGFLICFFLPLLSFTDILMGVVFNCANFVPILRK